MSDPLSIIGLVASILQLVETIVMARNCVKGFNDASRDQKEFLAEVKGLKPLLAGLDTRIKASKSVGVVNGIQQFEEPLVRLNAILNRLTKKLDKGGGTANTYSRLAWPLWGKNELQEGLNTIERFKSLLGTWLAIDIWESTQAQGKNHDDPDSVWIMSDALSGSRKSRR
ncbi:hypothetical protein B0H16DRAFT_1482453 [Mycena metata]|uniref:NACHT-NTPase and P-loop NTPases N-terminal domain-containing protein n=1 Tax=Mycena metata TaxID=1033252 RepID=A0AAD7M7X4_9AGAR|nr:hypothetical protein B0H16DRAFT_1482453 [Mycena metata]